MDLKSTQHEPHFSQPVRQVVTMLAVIGMVAVGGFVGYGVLRGIFLTNVYLNTLILSVFVLGILSCFAQLYALMRSIDWIEAFAADRGGLPNAPSILAPLATLLRARGARSHISASSGRSILDSVASRIDEDREITRYLGNTLIFLGLLGTFYGLATTVPALVETIRGLTPKEGETGADIFMRLQQGLESQLGGMGTAFSSSLLGLVGSLIIGLLELFAGHGQNRFYRELEEWLSTITRISLSSGEEGAGDGGGLAGVLDQLAEQMESLQMMFSQSDMARSLIDDRLGELTTSIGHLVNRIAQDDSRDALLRVADGQERLLEQLRQSGGDGIDAESRMRLRSIDVQLLRILEEMAAGRQESMADIRADLNALTRAVRQTKPGAGSKD